MIRRWSRARKARRRLAGLFLAVVTGCTSTPSPAPATPDPTAGLASPLVAASPDPTQQAATPSLPVRGTTTPPIPDVPRSADLILEALEAGCLDEPTALLYRVFAVFGDQRLPAAYQSPVWEEDGSALAEAVLQLGTLPAETAGELRPFLARPTDPVSVFHGPGTTGRRLATAALAVARPGPAGEPAAPAASACDAATNWGYLDGTHAFRVWGHCTGPADRQLIAEAVDAVEDLWPGMNAFMGDPVPDEDPDGTGPPEASDGRIDIYLVDQCTTRAGRCMWDAGLAHALAAAPPVAAFRGDEGALASSGFIIVGRQTFGSELRSTLAHELFHVLEFAHNMEGLSSAGWHWFTEASAKWAEWYFVPESRAETVYPWFDEYQSSSRGLESTAGNNEYASYLWPYHMEQERRAGAIQAAWVAIDGKRDHRSITAAIDGKLPFAESYRKLAVRAWNETLRPGNAYDKRLQDLDRTLPELLPGGRRISATGLLPANAPGTPPRRIPESIESLYSRYGQFQVHDDVGQVTFDFGKLDPRDALDVDALLKIKGKGWEHRAWPNGKVRLCTNDPDDDAEEIIVVLSNHDIDPRLYIEGEWTVESLKEPCSGWEVEITWTDEYAGIKDTITLQGSIDTLDAEAPGDGAFLVGGHGIGAPRWLEGVQPRHRGGAGGFGARGVRGAGHRRQRDHLRLGRVRHPPLGRRHWWLHGARGGRRDHDRAGSAGR